MRSFHCDCGNRVFFDNQACLACGRALGFDFAALRLVPLAVEGEYRIASNGTRFRPCANQREHGNCNWLVAVDDAADLCPAWTKRNLVAHWPLPDPSFLPGTDEQRLEAAVRVAERLRLKIERLIALDFDRTDKASLTSQLEMIGQL